MMDDVANPFIALGSTMLGVAICWGWLVSLALQEGQGSGMQPGRDVTVRIACHCSRADCSGARWISVDKLADFKG